MAYTNSSLVTVKVPAVNPKTQEKHYTVGRTGNKGIDMITIHCTAGNRKHTAKQIGLIFQDKKSSSNYGIGGDGSVGLFVDEKDRSWCSSNSTNDNRAITIEVASDNTRDCICTEEAYKMLIRLVTDICIRNKIKELRWKGNKDLFLKEDFSGDLIQNISVHRWWANKSCPGRYLYNKLTDIANTVNKVLGSSYINKPVEDDYNYGYPLPVNPPVKPSPSDDEGGNSKENNNSNEYWGVSEETIAKIKNSRTNHLSDNILSLKNKIESVNRYIKNNHDIQPFIEFEVNGFKLNTRDPNSFKHYAISMTNQKTGVGQGNQFKIKIAYHKQFSNYESINQLELALGPYRKNSLLSYNNSNNMNTTRDNIKKNLCKLRYGYNTENSTLISPLYTGLLLKYSVTANKQIVEYTLEGYTGEQISVNTVNWYPNLKGMEDYITFDGRKIAVATLTTKDAEKLTDVERDELIRRLNTDYASGYSMNPYQALLCFLYDYNNSVNENSTKYYVIDCTDGSKGKLIDNNVLEPVKMSICKGQTPIQYIEYCIGLFKYTKTTNYAIQYLQQELKTSERFIYNFVRDPDDINKMYVCIDVIEDLDSDSKVAYEFTGYANDNNLLIDYNLNYDGTVALAVADNYDEETKDNIIFIDKDGALRRKTSITKDMFVAGEIDDVLITKNNTWLDKISVANNCTMTTMGLPFEISVGTVFKCGVYITDVKHHTSGNCYVTSITDTINNSKFTTSFNMIRLPGKNSAIDDDSVLGV